MDYLTPSLQVIVAVSVLYVWTFRNPNVIKEFKQFNLPDLTRNIVGTAKIALATLLLVGLCYPELVFPAASGMAVFMGAAQYFHFSVRNKLLQRLPSFLFLIACILIALETTP
jgi:hypothetical protein